MDIKKLKELRDETGISYSLCKKALFKSDDDVQSAKKLLNKWGIKKAKDKSSRKTSQGAIFSYVHHNKKIASLVELLCETDFVAKNEDFQKLGTDLAMQVASVDPKNGGELLKSSFIKDQAKTIENVLQECILKIGENIKIGRFARYEI